MNFTCLVFGEGRRDKKFLGALIDLPKFKYHTKKWFFTPDNASGSSPKIILEQCKRATLGKSYDLVLCFIDLDKLKTDYPANWKREKVKLGRDYPDTHIVWQIDSAEDEYRRVIGDECRGKHKLNKLARQKIHEFINTDYWKRTLDPIRKKEEELEQ